MKRCAVAAAVVAVLAAGGCRKGAESRPAASAPAAAPAASAPATAPATVPAGEGMVPVEIKTPKPLFEGTPKPVDAAWVEKPSGKLRPPFLAPAGTKNLAFHRPVTASDAAPVIGELDQAVDGDKEGTDGHFVELGPGKQWVQVDLGGPHTIYAVVLWHYHKQARAYKAVAVQVADDEDFLTNVRTVFNADQDNTLGLGVGRDKGYVETAEGRLIPAGGIVGRYVRCYSAGNTANDANHYIEVEVYGR